MFKMVFCTNQMFLVVFIISQAVSQPIVTVEQGDLLGKTVHFEDDYLGLSKNIDIFQGIPFVEPPTGSNRLRPPVPKAKWNGLYNATYMRDICPQHDNPDTEGFPQSEDCLYLDVYVSNPKVSCVNIMIYHI